VVPMFYTLISRSDGAFALEKLQHEAEAQGRA